MKLVAILGFLLVNPLALAAHGWSCSADGYTYFPSNPADPGGFGQRQSVSGPVKASEADARAAALGLCVSLGWQGCQVGSCMNL